MKEVKDLEQRYKNVLEFNKIQEMLANCTTNEISREMVLCLEPSSDIDEVKALQEQLSYAINLILKKGNPDISGLCDITAAVKRGEKGGVMNTKELLNIARVLKIARNLRSYHDETSVLSYLFDCLTEDRKLENAIYSAIISEDEIADSASPELADIRRKISNTHGKIREHLNNLIHSPKYQKYLQESIITIRDGRYVVPVKAEHRSDVGGIVHDMSATGSTIFVEPNAVVSENNNIRELMAKEKAEIEKILYNFTAMAVEKSHELFVNQRTICAIDFIIAKAKLALKQNAISPKINDRGYVVIEKGRHPLLDPKTVVPISLNLGKDFKTLVVTGPNTGGKTVTLKTVGLFCLMAACGLAVPAFDGTDICVFDNIFADIGDEQSIEQSLSTFSAHMTNIVSILNKVTPNSLVLFDELGAGTDPTEGAALAASILQYVKDFGALTVATTHYSEIKLYALTTDGVENASCEFDVNSLRPTYRLLIGVPGKSNAFAISKRLGLPEYIIQNAAERLSEENIKFEDVISNLEKSRQEAENERQLVERYKRDAEALKEELEKEKERVRVTRERLTENANKEARKILEQAKKEADEIISEIKRATKLKSEQDMNRALNEAKTAINKNIKDRDKAQIAKPVVNTNIPKKLLPGNTVEILDIGQKGTVLSKPNADGNVNLQVGIMKITSHISNLRLIKDGSTEKHISKQRTSTLKMANIKTEIDLRGQMLEDALFATEKYLDEAYLGGLNTVTVIHGKGTGVLRKGIHEMLRKNPCVKSFRLGVYGEGETGVTVVELKNH